MRFIIMNYFMCAALAVSCTASSSSLSLSLSTPAFVAVPNHKLNNIHNKRVQILLAHNANQDECHYNTDINGLSGRREWLVKSSTAAAAAGIISTTSPSRALAAATLEAPPATTTTPTSTSTTTSLSTLSASSQPFLCDPSITVWTKTVPTTQQQRIIYLLGTAHISTSSAELAGQLVRNIKPDAVFVELDAKRVSNGGNVRVQPVVSNAASASASSPGDVVPQQLAPSSSTSRFEITSNASPSSSQQQQQQQQQQQPASQRSIFDIKGRLLDAGSKMVGDSIRGLYKKLGAEGFNPGEEFVVAVKEGLAVGSQIVLGDRDVDITLRRLTEALSKTDLKKLAASDSDLEKSMREFLPSGGGSSASINDGLSSSSSSSSNSKKSEGELDKEYLARYVEVVKARENVRVIMKSVQDAAPELYQAMVAERDEYMAKGLDKIDMFGSTVAVMGIAHVDGVERNLEERGWKCLKVGDCLPN